MTKAKSSDLISVLEPYFTKQAPFQIPKEWRENLVNWIPWINLVIGILLLPLALAAIGLAGLIGTLATVAGVTVGPMILISGLFLLATIAILFITFPAQCIMFIMYLLCLVVIYCREDPVRVVYTHQR